MHIVLTDENEDLKILIMVSNICFVTETGSGGSDVTLNDGSTYGVKESVMTISKMLSDICNKSGC